MSWGMQRFGGGYLFASLRLLGIFTLVALTNIGVIDHVKLLIESGRWGTLGAFLAVWAVAVVAIIVAAFQPSFWVRAAWALVIALGGAAGYAFYRASGSQLSIFDAVSLWNARHEAGRAFEFYNQHVTAFALTLVAGFVLFALPPMRFARAEKYIRMLALVPIVPVLLFSGIMYAKEGGGSRGLTAQFAPYSIGMLSGVKIASNSMPQRRAVEWMPGEGTREIPKIRRVILLVDESVRADYIDWRPGNPFTPNLAGRKDRIVDFGPAASGGNCSHYSNAILRFMASRDDLGRKILNNPTVWQYAKKAGYRTVFIDAQAAFIRRMAGYPGKLQNFMTPEEMAQIDGFNAIDETLPAHALDDALLDVILKELKGDQPVFIYANKNGAHFPYEKGYPADAGVFQPATARTPDEITVSRVNAYRNVIRWSVDRILGRLFEEADLRDTVVIYTSDHGQLFASALFTQCTIQNPDPRQALVPLFVIAPYVLQVQLAAASSASKGHGSHFTIMPTVLQLMGYAKKDIAASYGPSMFEPSNQPPAFTSGDVLGLFSSNVRWNAIDLGRSYLEPEAERSSSGVATAAAGSR